MKGFWRTLESVFSILLILSFLLIVTNSIRTQIKTYSEPVSIGYEILKQLDSEDLLRPLAINGEYEKINEKIILEGFNHSIVICDERGECIGTYNKNANNIFVSTYIISGDENYKPLEIRLYMW
ncbi:MAG: hypothetical protein QW051_00710 [Candidatus Aenigmatarchaeota archaeon]